MPELILLLICLIVGATAGGGLGAMLGFIAWILIVKT